MSPAASASQPAASSRPAADRCPGLLRPHVAADGAMVRLRVPGGRMTAHSFAALRAMAQGYGDGDIHLTSRANIQLRGLPTGGGGDGDIAHPVEALLRRAGFLPSPTHERVRNIVAPPLSGIVPGLPDVRPVVARLDAAVCAEPALAALSGRFLFGIDAGGGSIATLGCDLLAVCGLDGRFRIVAGDAPGPAVDEEELPRAIVALAVRFAAIADGRWRVRDLPGRGRELVEDAHGGPDDTGPADTAPAGGYGADPAAGSAPAPLGILPGGALSVLAPLGVLTPDQSAALAHAAGPRGEVIVTPWRGVIVAPGPSPAGADHAALARLTDAGLVTDGRSPWTRITACIGSPGCAKSAGDTRAAARDLAESGGPDRPTHIVGCDRACGAPKTAHVLHVLRPLADAAIGTAEHHTDEIGHEK